MFYSHEILTSQAYGVATVWLVSTIGFRTTTRKISRKAIQEVDVQKACETILQPGAPIALRLQGSLLYGLSRVYSQQCHYVLTDAERVQAHMRAFYSAIGESGNALDPLAVKSKRNELILEDDPEFELNPDLPTFHFDDDGYLVIPQSSQASRKTSSQLSPLQTDGSFTSSNRSILAGFDLSQSPFGGRNSIIRDQFGAGTMTPAKEDSILMPFGDEERELPALDDWGIEIDADGNIVLVAEEPQLPRLPQPEEPQGEVLMQDDEIIQFDDQGDVIMGDLANGFRSDPPLPIGQGQERNQEQESEIQQEEEEQEVVIDEEASSGQAPVRVQRQRRRPVLAPDNQTKITREELRSWSTNYLASAEKSSRRSQTTSTTEARKNAFNLVFGQGITRVGFPTGIPGLSHPLATYFAGEGLQASLVGIVITPPDEDIEAARGHRRSALEALGPEPEDANRRVRRRLSEDPDEASQHAQPQLDDGLPLILGDDDLPPIEIGRRAASLLQDDNIPSDVPWNRPSSQIPSSSVKNPRSRHVSASPLHARGSLALPGPEIERFSDDANPPPFGSDDFAAFAPLHSGPAGGGNSSASDPFGGPTTETQTTSQLMRTALDREGQNFLSFLESVARNDNHNHTPDENDNDANHTRKWIDFSTLFEPQDQKRAVIVQAFYHVLSLATKAVIKVTQEGQGGTKAFGAIRLGVEISDEVGFEDGMEGWDAE
ncbi:hypothetical protein C8A05DRAFT_35139 [Staphylotrichum tortipilum]|uniref:Uncharacterized protein n=1 Tax=Staphylotrichum tortipilum TaxID=2831512 RepID=A0AAN6MJE4_9PEZI|nr:hypothetical protein C8A05DRAFT_35139 [Staphylotrichum longicolle]